MNMQIYSLHAVIVLFSTAAAAFLLVFGIKAALYAGRKMNENDANMALTTIIFSGIILSGAIDFAIFPHIFHKTENLLFETVIRWILLNLMIGIVVAYLIAFFSEEIPKLLKRFTTNPSRRLP